MAAILVCFIYYKRRPRPYSTCILIFNELKLLYFIFCPLGDIAAAALDCTSRTCGMALGGRRGERKRERERKKSLLSIPLAFSLMSEKARQDSPLPSVSSGFSLNIYRTMAHTTSLFPKVLSFSSDLEVQSDKPLVCLSLPSSSSSYGKYIFCLNQDLNQVYLLC